MKNWKGQTAVGFNDVCMHNEPIPVAMRSKAQALDRSPAGLNQKACKFVSWFVACCVGDELVTLSETCYRLCVCVCVCVCVIARDLGNSKRGVLGQICAAVPQKQKRSLHNRPILT